MTPAVSVALPTGTVSVPLIWNHADDPEACVVLAHGAGAGPEHPFLDGFAARCASTGLTVVRFPFPYVVAGRRLPGPAAHAVATWRTVFEAVRGTASGLSIIAAGKSYGGRMASVAAAEGAISPDGLVYLGYPLHPPGRPDRPRTEHLPFVEQPQLFVSGTRDPFVDPLTDLEAAVAACQDAQLQWVEGGRHSFETAGGPRDASVVGAGIADLARAWISARSRR
ncbi:alpha/beta hydrolase family protein [Microbacterium thalli]|uniref:alpha/beta hydrolase family protein n=1 Tax=Microbacterium thalli TaxID=3027921 RepID=UPI00236713DB|nr:alpha/beta family hydrolase [Microbacterium thalli]MDD7929563.1 dienelactone hydrolase family protein [Microbacterium thalli]